jgi:hypothetical protein
LDFHLYALHILSVCEGKKEGEGQSVQCQVIPYTAEDILLIQISTALSGNTRNNGREDKKGGPSVQSTTAKVNWIPSYKINKQKEKRVKRENRHKDMPMGPK